MTTSTLAEPAPVRPADLVGLAADIGAVLCRTALWHGGRCLWLGDEVVPVDGEYVVVHQDCGGSLYGGTAGIGWFLAHLSRRTGDPAAAEAARGALRHALAWADEQDGPSLYAGAGGVGWALLDGGIALGDEALASEGLRVMTGATERAVARDLPGELIGGRAGLVLGGLAGAVAAEGAGLSAARLTEVVHEHGRLLLGAAHREPTGWTWPGEDGIVLCGMGHGTSGPVLACAELAATTGDASYREAAAEGARSERGWLSPRTGWPDLREYDRSDLDSGTTPSTPPFWCHGTVGVGLARIRAHRLLADDSMLADATVALHRSEIAATVLPEAEPGSYAANFSLCHGAAGLMELFVTAAMELADPTWLARVAAVAGVGKQHLDAGAGWRCGVADGREAPGLMLGLAGTGAALLRAAEPDAVTSPLLFGTAV